MIILHASYLKIHLIAGLDERLSHEHTRAAIRLVEPLCANELDPHKLQVRNATFLCTAACPYGINKR